MGFFIFLIIVVILGGIIFIQIKISNLEHRATQHILKDTAISESSINKSIYQGFEEKHLEKFLQENPNYTEETIKQLLKEYSVKLINKQTTNNFSSEIYEKIQNDNKLTKMQNMYFKHINITRYQEQKLNAIVTYTDNKDEYNIVLFCKITENGIIIEKYRTEKGAVVGF